MMERLFQLNVSCSSGVCPRGAHVRTRVGRVLRPLSSRKTIKRPYRRAFFYRGPLRAFPVADGWRVAFHRPALRTLATETQRAQEPPDMSRVVTNSGPLLDQRGDTGQGPELRLVALSGGSFQERFNDGLGLSWGQLWLATGGSLARQGCRATRLPSLLPAINHLSGYAQAPRYLRC